VERLSVTAGRRRRRTTGRIALVGVLAVVLTARTAAAQAPEAVRDGQVAPGVYVGTNPVDPAPLSSAVNRARQAGVQLVVVVAEDPRPDADAFATRVRQLGVGDPVLVLGPGGQLGVSSEDVAGSDLLRARAAAAAATTPDAATDAFVQVLLHDEDTSVPDLVWKVVRIGAVALVVLVLTAVADRALRRRRRRRRLARSAPSGVTPG
jgi:hypothetical protein